MGRNKEITFEEALERVKDEIVDAATIAEVLNVTPAAVNIWAQRKRIPTAYEDGRFRRFRIGAVLKKFEGNFQNRRARQ